MNEKRIEQIQERQRFERPSNRTGRPQPGDTVTHKGAIGVIDAAFFDLQAAVENGIVDASWYADQDTKPKTAPAQRWYSVILPHGAVLVGEEDL